MIETLNIKKAQCAIEEIIAQMDSVTKDFGIEVEEISISTVNKKNCERGQTKKYVTIRFKSFR